MNDKHRKGMLLPFLKSLYKQSIYGINTGLFKLLLALEIVIVTVVSTQAQELKIGDRLPQVLWDTPLQVINHPEGKSSITLGDYKGKLIILDFWATSCATCIEKMPELQQLQERFKEDLVILPASYEKREHIAAFKKRNPIMVSLALPSIVEDRLLKTYFPHQLLPHVVWIDARGTLLALTESEQVDSNAIAGILEKSRTVFLSHKYDRIDFDYSKPILGKEGARYSKLGPHLEGLPYKGGIYRDSINGTQRYMVVNAGILQLYALALQRGDLVFSAKRRVLDLEDTSSYIYRPENGYRADWHRKNSWCYETVTDIGKDRKNLGRQMLSSLNSFFGLNGRIEPRLQHCWVLVKDVSAVQRVTTKDQNSTLGNLLTQVNKDSRFPPLIDETGEEREMSLFVPREILGVEALAQQLKPQGLLLYAEERYLDTFVLSHAVGEKETIYGQENR